MHKAGGAQRESASTAFWPAQKKRVGEVLGLHRRAFAFQRQYPHTGRDLRLLFDHAAQVKRLAIRRKADHIHTWYPARPKA